MPLEQELVRGEVVEGLVRADGVVDSFPSEEFLIERGDFCGVRSDLVKLFGVGAMGAFDGAVEFGGAGREDEQAEAALLTGLLEFGGEFAAAVDLHGANGKRHSTLDGVEKMRGGRSGGAGVRFKHVPTGNNIAGGEMLKGHARQRTHIESVDLDEIAWLRRPIFLGFSHSVGPRSQPAARTVRRAERLDQQTTLPEILQNTTDHGSRQGQSLLREQDNELVFAPPRKALTQSENLLGQLGSPSGFARVEGPMRTALQRKKIEAIKASTPDVEGLTADAEVAAGEGNILAVGAMKIKPGQTNQCLPAQLLPQTRKLAGLGKLLSIDMHADTLIRVSTIILNEHRTKMEKGVASTRSVCFVGA
jgi:hypothetical protein